MPTANPSGRLWTKRTRKTRAEVRAPGPLRPMNAGVGVKRRRARPGTPTPTASPPSTAAADPSSSPGSAARPPRPRPSLRREAEQHRAQLDPPAQPPDRGSPHPRARAVTGQAMRTTILADGEEAIGRRAPSGPPGLGCRGVDVIDQLVANNREFAASLPEQHLDVRPQPPAGDRHLHGLAAERLRRARPRATARRTSCATPAASSPTT